MPDLIIKAHDTYPPIVSALSQNGALIDLSTATSIKFEMKQGATLVTGAGVKLTVVTPTATLATGSNILTSVSSFTNIVIGGSITGAGIPVGARVGAFDSIAGTITMIAAALDANGNPVPVNATASASGVTLTINKGCVSYTLIAEDTSLPGTYSAEWEITWTGGGIQTVPNALASNNTIQIDQDVENA